jgi:hypothetical protein
MTAPSNADLGAGYQAIHRFTIPVDDADHKVNCLRFLAVDRRPNAIDLVDVFCLVDLEGPMTSREFRVVGTGHPVPEGYTYRGTAERADGALVWHVMEAERVPPNDGSDA